MGDYAQIFDGPHSLSGLPIVCGQHKHCPIPFPLPLFSPMGRLLSSWPAHGEKRGRGKGMGHWFFCLHRTLYLGWALSVSVCPGFCTWVCPFAMTELYKSCDGPHSLSGLPIVWGHQNGLP